MISRRDTEYLTLVLSETAMTVLGWISLEHEVYDRSDAAADCLDRWSRRRDIDPEMATWSWVQGSIRLEVTVSEEVVTALREDCPVRSWTIEHYASCLLDSWAAWHLKARESHWLFGDGEQA